MYAVEFSNLSYFAKCFKLECGVSPKKYQQKESKHNFDIPENFSAWSTPESRGNFFYNLPDFSNFFSISTNKYFILENFVVLTTF